MDKRPAPQEIDFPIGLAKAILWEEAKGKLRALIAATGAIPSNLERGGGYYLELQKKIDAFIKSFEDNGYHE